MKMFLSVVNKFKRAITLLKRGAQPSVSGILESSEDKEKVTLKKGRKAGNKWDEHLEVIKTEFINNPMSFLRQPELSLTVHPNQQKIASLYLQDMRKSSFARTKLLARLQDVPIGDPYLCEDFPLASPMSIQHARYIMLLKQHLDLFIPESKLGHIVEFGGGYGNFCRLTFSLGYSKEYDIIDFPEMHSIQGHYLKHALPERTIEKNVSFCSIEDVANKSFNNEKSLFMATFSLNETPIEVREQVEPLIKNFDYLFFAYNRKFDGIDNLAYFEKIKQQLSSEYDLKIVKDDHRPAWFMVGKKNHNGSASSEN